MVRIVWNRCLKTAVGGAGVSWERNTGGVGKAETRQDGGQVGYPGPRGSQGNGGLYYLALLLPTPSF